MESFQQIGSNVVTSIPKVAEGDTIPPWFVEARDYMKGAALGEEWQSLVDSWISLEEILFYGKGCKVRSLCVLFTVSQALIKFQPTLPCKSRPREWAEWNQQVSKGARQLNSPPFIKDPQEFGVAVTRWWTFLKSNKQEGAREPWVKLMKAGKNGLLSLLLQMLWWGQAALPGPSEFMGDSRQAWRDLLIDVKSMFSEMLDTRSTLEAMNETTSNVSRAHVSPTGLKRSGPELVSRGPTKRSKRSVMSIRSAG